MAPKEGTQAYLRFDSPSRGRLLELATVRDVGDGRWTLEFAERHSAVETGAERLCYYKRAREFLRQPVRIESQSSAGPPYRLTLVAIGDAESADTRSAPRVDTSGCGLEATLDNEPHCPIQDVSLSGLAVVATRAHRVGQPLEVAIPYGEAEYVGDVEVMGITPLLDGRTRYGLLGEFDTAQGRQLKIGLTRMTLEIQQRQIQRRSGG